MLSITDEARVLRVRVQGWSEIASSSRLKNRNQAPEAIMVFDTRLP